MVVGLVGLVILMVEGVGALLLVGGLALLLVGGGVLSVGHPPGGPALPTPPASFTSITFHNHQ